MDAPIVTDEDQQLAEEFRRTMPVEKESEEIDAIAKLIAKVRDDALRQSRDAAQKAVEAERVRCCKGFRRAIDKLNHRSNREWDFKVDLERAVDAIAITPPESNSAPAKEPAK